MVQPVSSDRMALLFAAAHEVCLWQASFGHGWSSRECEHRGRMSRPRTLAVARGNKVVAFATAPVNVTHPKLVRRLAWDISLKNV
jgi:hypothetical protein